MSRSTLAGLAALAGVAVIWWLTPPDGIVEFGPLTQPIQGAGDGPPDLVGGLEPPAIAMARPENLRGQGMSNAEVDRIVAGWKADVQTRGAPETGRDFYY